MIPASPLHGLRILYAGACIRKGAFGDGNVTERDIAFRMAPLLNAAGRMGDPLPAAKLLLAETEETAWRNFKVLDLLNRDRKKRQEDICRRLGNSPQLLGAHSEHCVLALVDEDCPPGLAGLAAARLAETTGRPTCVLVPGEDESGPLYRGSMRTGSDEDLLVLMSGVSSITEKLGGHSGALGLTVRPERIQEFVESCRSISCPRRQPKLTLDAYLKTAPTDPEEVRQLDMTRPWGHGNPQPTFAWGPVTVKGTRQVGKNLEHIQMTLRDKGGSLCKGIGFNMAEDVSRNIDLDQEVRAAGHFQVNFWQGNESVEFEIKDLETA
jgi:single-stranded-DNA-specific exonuclease